MLSTRQKLLLLDFDGTLAPIVPTPGEAKLEKEIEEALALLSASRRCKIAIISGRSLSDLMSHFRCDNLIYAGNHGFEIKGKGMKLPPRANSAKKLGALMWHLSKKLIYEFSRMPGVRIENKTYTLSVHYRGLSGSRLSLFSRKMRDFRKKCIGWPIIWKKGKKVWEAHPYVRWGKGNLALYLADKFRRALPIVIGDDLADEEMFEALKGRGVTVRVGRSKTSGAQYYLKSCREVGRFLKSLHSNGA
jgi:trehalose-phosphatase